MCSAWQSGHQQHGTVNKRRRRRSGWRQNSPSMMSRHRPGRKLGSLDGVGVRLSFSPGCRLGYTDWRVEEHQGSSVEARNASGYWKTWSTGRCRTLQHERPMTFGSYNEKHKDACDLSLLWSAVNIRSRREASRVIKTGMHGSKVLHVRLQFGNCRIKHVWEIKWT